jgi:uncharacterized protein
MAGARTRARLGGRLIAYVDASALVKLFLDEVGCELAREIWESDIPVATARITQAEIACGLEAAVRNRRLERGRIDEGVDDGTFLWERADAIEATRKVVDTAATLGVRHGLRGVDAVHVASALHLGVLGPFLVSWDTSQRRAAQAEGLPIYPDAI